MRLVLSLVGAFLVGCPSPPPPSQFPSAGAAIERMRETQSCSRGVQGEAKVDYFGDQGRVRGNALFIVSRPDRVRLDVFSPFGVTLSTLTADGHDFALLDVSEKRFFHGPARSCNVRRFLQVPVPPHALASFMTGRAPVLVHTPAAAQIEWSGGRYEIRIQSQHSAEQLIALAPHPADFEKPWQEQRVRVEKVRVEQHGIELYDVELGGHAPAKTAGPRIDPIGIDPDVPPSGPECRAEIPRRLRFVSELSDSDVIFALKEVVHNPPLIQGLFQQRPPRGVSMSYSDCLE